MRWFLCFCVALAACNAAPPLTITPTLRPMPAGVTVSAPQSIGTLVIIASPTPAPTPITHVVANGETLIGIAVKYGVGLEELQAANPAVSAQFLSVGTQLIIPASASSAPIQAVGAPTPVPLTFGEPQCFPTAIRGWLCLVEAINPNATAVEAVSARLTLAGADGLPLAEAMADPIANVIAPGGGVPLVSRFAPPAPAFAALGVQTVTALPLADVASRFILLETLDVTTEMRGVEWTVRGMVRNPAAVNVARARIALALYSEAGMPVGARQIDLEAGLAAGEARAFIISASILGGEAARTQLFAEGQP